MPKPKGATKLDAIFRPCRIAAPVKTAAAGAVVVDGRVATLTGMDDAGTEYGGMEDGRMEG